MPGKSSDRRANLAGSWGTSNNMNSTMILQRSVASLKRGSLEIIQIKGSECVARGIFRRYTNAGSVDRLCGEESDESLSIKL